MPKKKVRNKSRDIFMDYYKTGLEYDEDNRKRKEEMGYEEPKGLKHLSSFEVGCIAFIILAAIGFFVKIVVLGHGFSDARI